MKPRPGGGGLRGGSGRVHTPSSSDFQHVGSQADGAHYPCFGHRDDDQYHTPRSEYPSPMGGVPMDGVVGNRSAERVHGGPGGSYPHGRGGNPGRHASDVFFDSDQDVFYSAQGNIISPCPNGNGCSGAAGKIDTLGMYTDPDDVPPAAPRRLVPRCNSPSRPERSGAKNNGNGGDGGCRGGKKRGHLMDLNPNTVDTDGGRGQDLQRAARGFNAYTNTSPIVAVSQTAPGLGGRWRGHSPSGTQQESSRDVEADGSKWRTVFHGHPRSPSRFGDGGALGEKDRVVTPFGLDRMEEVRRHGNESLFLLVGA